MPCRKFRNGWKIKRGSKPGYYPKVYTSKKACLIRVDQMESHRSDERKLAIKKKVAKAMPHRKRK